MIGVGQIVIDRFRDADDSHVIAAADGFVLDFVGCILRIVAAGIKKIADVMGLKNLKKPVHFPGGPFRFLFEIDLVTAGAEGGGRGMLERLDGFGQFLAQINQVLVENSKNAVPPAKYMGNAAMTHRFLHHSSQTGIDDGGWTPGLRH